MSLSVIAQTNKIPNPLIDYAAFQRQVKGVGPLREKHRLTEDQFIQASIEPDTIILDARSSDKYAMLHIKGARNIPLTDFTAAELAKVIPSKTARILIYCNNNFLNSPRAFATKAPAASLNVYTFNNLVSYGYTNVYELGPLANIDGTKLSLEGTDMLSKPRP
ncbi:MAG: rhodanese-like domain-containing protein [Limisphaerales bacterium]